MLDVVELTKEYFKLSDGRIYEQPFEIDDSISKEEFKKLLDDSEKIIEDIKNNISFYGLKLKLLIKKKQHIKMNLSMI